MFGCTSANRISLGPGNDRLFGRDGNDPLAGDGADGLDGGGGSALARGPAWRDTASMPISRKRWPSCPAERALVVLSGRWKAMTVWHLGEGPRRFTALRSAIGRISDRVLTQVLAELAEDGVVERDPVGWRLTPRGTELLPVLLVLFEWGQGIPARPAAAGAGSPVAPVRRAVVAPGKPVRRTAAG